jgi:hypothetical protein
MLPGKMQLHYPTYTQCPELGKEDRKWMNDGQEMRGRENRGVTALPMGMRFLSE